MTDVTVFIDEAGDPGVRDGLKYVGTRHEWMCVSAFVVRSSREESLVEWVKHCRAAANSRQAGALHFHKIHRDRRTPVCESLAANPCRTFTVASHKTNVREYVNPRIQKMIDSGTFYNWCMRLLMERVTAWVEARAKEGQVGLGPLKVVFADRGHDWEHFFAYVDKLEIQSRTKSLYLKGPGLHHTLLDREHWSVVKADKLAGLQCADVVASAFYQAANTASPSHDLRPARALSPIVTKAKGIARNLGLTVWPLPAQADIPKNDRAIFNSYGYDL